MGCGRNRFGESGDLVRADPGHGSGNTDSSDWFTVRVEDWGAHAARTLHGLFVIDRVALPPDLLEFLAKLQQVHNGSRRRWLERDRGQNILS